MLMGLPSRHLASLEQLVAEAGKSWKDSVSGLRHVDWARSNTAVWEGTAMVDGRISKSPLHVTRTADLLKRHFGVQAKGTKDVLRKTSRQSSRNA